MTRRILHLAEELAILAFTAITLSSLFGLGIGLVLTVALDATKLAIESR